MKPRFQADADLNEDILTGVIRRESQVDFQKAEEAGLSDLDDLQVLALAAREGRILVSHDRKTMPRHFAGFIQSNTSPGLIIVSQRTDARAAIEELLMIWSASEAEEWTNNISTIPL